MTYKEYNVKKFMCDLKSMDISSPEGDKPSCGKSLYLSHNMLIFKCDGVLRAEDFPGIETADITWFFLSLYSDMIFDYTVFSYYGPYYFKYKRLYKFPVYNNTGFNLKCENPSKLLKMAAGCGLLDIDKIKSGVNDFTDLLFEKSERCFGQNILEISPENFIRSLFYEIEMSMDEYKNFDILSLLYESLKSKIYDDVR